MSGRFMLCQFPSNKQVRVFFKWFIENFSMDTSNPRLSTFHILAKCDILLACLAAACYLLSFFWRKNMQDYR